IKLKVCANFLDYLVHLVIGSSLAKNKCCCLIDGLVDLDVVVCPFTVLKANVLEINLNIAVFISLLINNCAKYASKNFKCA
ncbi:hypothetical protein MTR67_002120, partial [Solanum verrucosum]